MSPEEFSNRYNAHYRCFHGDKQLVWADRRPGYSMRTGDMEMEPFDGGIQLRYQCLSCGNLLTQAVKRTLANGSTPQVSMELMQYWIDEENFFKNNPQATDARRFKTDQDRLDDPEFRISYETYIRSPEWMAKRNRIMARANGICEGCGEREARHVHHLTYAHFGYELLWELKAVCLECHQICHPDKRIFG